MILAIEPCGYSHVYINEMRSANMQDRLIVDVYDLSRQVKCFETLKSKFAGARHELEMLFVTEVSMVLVRQNL